MCELDKGAQSWKMQLYRVLFWTADDGLNFNLYLLPQTATLVQEMTWMNVFSGSAHHLEVFKITYQLPSTNLGHFMSGFLSK